MQTGTSPTEHSTQPQTKCVANPQPAPAQTEANATQNAHRFSNRQLAARLESPRNPHKIKANHEF
jgi:hypothetical protein